MTRLFLSLFAQNLFIQFCFVSESFCFVSECSGALLDMSYLSASSTRSAQGKGGGVGGGAIYFIIIHTIKYYTYTIIHIVFVCMQHHV
jgi:hypothetical protein